MGKIYVGDTLVTEAIITIPSINLLNDTVTADRLVSGYTAHNARGTQITGTLPTIGGTGLTWNELTSTSWGIISDSSQIPSGWIRVAYDGSSDEYWNLGSYPPSGAIHFAIEKPHGMGSNILETQNSYFHSDYVINGSAVGSSYNIYPSTALNITTVAALRIWLASNPFTVTYKNYA